MATVADLRLRVLQELGVIAAGETPSAEDAALIDALITRAQAELVQRGTALWVIDDIPDYIVEAYARFVAAMAAPAFGAMNRIEANAAREVALAEIYELTDEGESLAPVKAVYF